MLVNTSAGSGPHFEARSSENIPVETVHGISLWLFSPSDSSFAFLKSQVPTDIFIGINDHYEASS